MKPLITNQRILIWMCAYPTKRTDDIFQRLSHILFSIFVFLTNISCFTASIAYFLKYATSDLNETLYATIQIAASFPMITVSLMIFFLRNKFKALFENLNKIYDHSKYY